MRHHTPKCRAGAPGFYRIKPQSQVVGLRVGRLAFQGQVWCRKGFREVGMVTTRVNLTSPTPRSHGRVRGVASLRCRGYNSASSSSLGTWRSPVAHCNGVAGVAGSNPAVPI
jgi:hypothetical protein